MGTAAGRRIVGAAVVVLVTITAAPSPARVAKVPSAGMVRKAMRQVVALGVPGGAVLIRRPGGVEFFQAGYGDVRRKARIRRTDRFRIASVAKAFNGAVVVALARRRALKLNDSVARRLPGVLAHGREITIAELLGHTSGLADYTRQVEFLQQVSRNPKRFWRPRELVAFVASKPLHFRPGTAYEYSDTDNIVLGLIVEAVTHRSYAQALRSLVYRPLRLRSTYLPTTPRISGRHLHGYDYDPGGRGTAEDVTTALNPTGAWASGGIVSTLPDLSRFFTALLRGRLTGRILLRRMQQTVPGSSSPPGPGTNRAGLAVFHYRLPCGSLWGHTGSFPGYRLFAAASGDGRRAVTFVANATNVSAHASEAILRVQQLAACRALGR